MPINLLDYYTCSLNYSVGTTGRLDHNEGSSRSIQDEVILAAGEGRGADIRAATAPLVEAPAEPASGMHGDDAAPTRQYEARLRTAASLVGSCNTEFGTDLEDVRHYWRPYERVNFRASEMFSKCDKRTTDMIMLERLFSSMNRGPWATTAPGRYESRFHESHSGTYIFDVR